MAEAHPLKQLAGGRRADAALAVHDHRPAGIETVEMARQFAERNMDGARDMPCPALVVLADVDELNPGILFHQASGFDRGHFRYAGKQGSQHLPERMQTGRKSDIRQENRGGHKKHQMAPRLGPTEGTGNQRPPSKADQRMGTVCRISLTILPESCTLF